MTRLASGGLIDRTAPIDFTFDGRRLKGFAGDTLASALVANDVDLVGRSFKYHRPRGILTAGSAEPNALVTVGTGPFADPNCRATTLELFDGLQAQSQNRWPSLAFDLLAVNQLFAPILTAGFYYKTFMWPRAFWERVYEPLIRRAAGLGRLSMEPDPSRYERDHGFCDLLIVGGGPAGLAAALTAGRAGLRVILADEDGRLGGRLLSERHMIDDRTGADWAAHAAAELASLDNVRLLPRTTIVGAFDGFHYEAVERLADHRPPQSDTIRQRSWTIVARRALLAAGATERMIAFGGNDRPGIMLSSAASTYCNRFAAIGKGRIAVFTTSDSGWQTALTLAEAGADLVAVIEARDTAPALADRLAGLGVRLHLGARVTDAVDAPLRKIAIAGRDGRSTLAVDHLLVAGGWSPAIGLASTMGDRPRWSASHQAFLVDTAPPGMVAIGAAAGKYSLSGALADGAAKAAAIAADRGRAAVALPVRASDDPAKAKPLWHVPERRSKAFVDFQNDVTADDVLLAAREGFLSVEHLKRYTTLGMGTDQGRTGQLNAHALLAEATGKAIGEVGTIMVRPPVQPVAIGAIAGHHRGEDYRPTRLTPSHAWAEGQSAPFIDVGLWKRAQFFPRGGDRGWRDAVDREVLATRGSVGVCDVSTLGKIDIQGPDAATLLDRLYVNSFSTLKVGRARYGLMLRDDGFALDDGTTSRLGNQRFFMTTTSANAAQVMQHLDFARQVRWPELDVQAVSVTDQWAAFAVAGPRSRELVQRLLPGFDLSNEAFPYLGAAETEYEGRTARLFRLSFSGELAFELSVPARHGEALLLALLEAGADLGVVPYGAEAMSVMRIEKGHIAGPELNGQTTARDLGLGSMMSSTKDFIGRALAERPGLTDPGRKQLVGLRQVAGKAPILPGAHLVRPGRRPSAAEDEGFVSSAAWSPSLGHGIALAFLAHGPERHGECVLVHDPVRNRLAEALVGPPVFLDPEGARLRA